MPDIVLPQPLTPVIPKPAKAGAPDPNFGVGGVAAHNVGITSTSDVAVQADGKSVIVGTTVTDGSGDFALTRYTANGSLDTTFGNQGRALTDFGGDDRATAVRVLPDGSILVAGTSTRLVNGAAAGSEFALARYDADGTLDTTFGNGTGKVLASFSSDPSNLSSDAANTLAVNPRGTIYVAGSSDAGGAGRDFAVAAFNADGSQATAFNGTGKALLDFTSGDDSVNGIAFGRNNDLILAGSTQNPATGTTAIALAKLHANGAVDPTFGKNGRVSKSVGGHDDEASSVAVQPDGKIVAGGFATSGSAEDGTLTSDFTLVRFTATGRIHRAFGNGGTVITSFGQTAAITSVLVLSNGKIVASGKTTATLASVAINQLDVAIAQYNSNGTLDPTFGGTGTTILSLGSAPGSVGSSPAGTSVGSTLKQKFDQLKQTAQGALAVNQGGQLLDVGTSGTDTVEAAIVSSGVDLVASVSASLPASLTSGTRGSATVGVTNNGPDAASGAITISLSASSTSRPGTAIQSLPQTVRLKAHQSRSVNMKFVFPAGLPKGSYNLIAQITPGSLNDLNLTNNIAAGPSFQIA